MCGKLEKSVWRKYKAGLHKGRSWVWSQKDPSSDPTRTIRTAGSWTRDQPLQFPSKRDLMYAFKDCCEKELS